MAKKTLISNQSIKVIEQNIIKINKCISIYNQIIDKIKDEDIKIIFILHKNDLLKSLEVSKEALNNAKKIITLIPKINDLL